MLLLNFISRNNKTKLRKRRGPKVSTAPNYLITISRRYIPLALTLTDFFNLALIVYLKKTLDLLLMVNVSKISCLKNIQER